MNVRICASILTADFARLGEEVAQAEAGGVDQFQADVMDGHFVPNLTFGPMVVAAVRRSTSLFLDVHLMIERPDDYLVHYAQAGADQITVHAETCTHLHRTLQVIRQLGKKAAVALNPATPLAAIEEVLDDLDGALLMTVNPGFGGQTLIPTVLPKVNRLRQEMIRRGRPDFPIVVDGGVHVETVPACVRAGANVLIAGSALYQHPAGVAAGVAALRAAIAAINPA